MNYDEEWEFLNLDIDEENTGSVRRIEEGFNKLNSQWILGFNATRYRYGKWIVTWIFNPITTSSDKQPEGKSPITQYGVETNQIISLQQTSSPGNFYISNVALKPNASGHGGSPEWRYASSAYGDLLRVFNNGGIKGLVTDIKQMVIPDAIQNHINEVNKSIRNLKNPLGNLKSFAQSQSKKIIDPLLEREISFTKKTIKLGFKASEFFLAPEATLGKKFWSLGTKKPRSLGKNLKNFKKL